MVPVVVKPPRFFDSAFSYLFFTFALFSAAVLYDCCLVTCDLKVVCLSWSTGPAVKVFVAGLRC